MKNILTLLALLLILPSCRNQEVIDDLSNESFTLITQDSTVIDFPKYYEGKYVVLGFIYTNCPDICPLITQNLRKIQEGLNNPEDVQFVGVTFDPDRDTPEVLARYKSNFGLNDNFDFLTGDSLNVAAFMDSVRVRTQVSYTTTTDDGRELYFLNHSDKIMVMNPRSQIIIEYGGSMPSVPNLIIEDLQKIR